MIVGELSEIVKFVLPGQTQAEATPFLHITNVGHAGGLQGLFDIELDPDFATNRYLYVFYLVALRTEIASPGLRWTQVAQRRR